MGWEQLVGSLEVGKRADLVVVRLPGSAAERLIRRGPVAEAVMRGEVRLTVVEGEVVYDGGAMPPWRCCTVWRLCGARLGLKG